MGNNAPNPNFCLSPYKTISPKKSSISKHTVSTIYQCDYNSQISDVESCSFKNEGNESFYNIEKFTGNKLRATENVGKNSWVTQATVNKTSLDLNGMSEKIEGYNNNNNYNYNINSINNSGNLYCFENIDDGEDNNYNNNLNKNNNSNIINSNSYTLMTTDNINYITNCMNKQNNNTKRFSYSFIRGRKGQVFRFKNRSLNERKLARVTDDGEKKGKKIYVRESERCSLKLKQEKNKLLKSDDFSNKNSARNNMCLKGKNIRNKENFNRSEYTNDESEQLDKTMLGDLNNKSVFNFGTFGSGLNNDATQNNKDFNPSDRHANPDPPPNITNTLLYNKNNDNKISVLSSQSCKATLNLQHKISADLKKDSLRYFKSTSSNRQRKHENFDGEKGGGEKMIGGNRNEIKCGSSGNGGGEYMGKQLSENGSKLNATSLTTNKIPNLNPNKKSNLEKIRKICKKVEKDLLYTNSQNNSKINNYIKNNINNNSNKENISLNAPSFLYSFPETNASLFSKRTDDIKLEKREGKNTVKIGKNNSSALSFRIKQKRSPGGLNSDSANFNKGNKRTFVRKNKSIEINKGERKRKGKK